MTNFSLNAFFVVVRQVLEATGNMTVGKCLKCPHWSQANVEHSLCVPCVSACHCPAGYQDLSGTCVRNGQVWTIPDVQSLYTVQYATSGKYYVSDYLRKWTRFSATKCKVKLARNLCINYFKKIMFIILFAYICSRWKIMESIANN